jgi:hypothetical protein
MFFLQKFVFFLEVRYENGANNGDHRSTTQTLNREQLAVSWRTSADYTPGSFNVWKNNPRFIIRCHLGGGGY